MKKLLEKLLKISILTTTWPYAVAAAATCQLTFTIDHSENGICHSNGYKDKAFSTSADSHIRTYLQCCTQSVL